MNIKRGDIFFKDLPGSEGHVQGYKNRPWVVVQNDKGNYFSGTTIVCPVTKKDKAELPTHVKFIWGAVSGTILTEQIRVIDQEEIEVVEHLPEPIMRHVDQALAVAIGLRE